MIDDGAPRYFDVPADVQDKDLSIQYLAHALAATDKYGVFGMREAVEGLLRCRDYLARCRKKPSTIVHAVKTVYALKPYGKNDRVLRELKDRFVEWAVALVGRCLRSRRMCGRSAVLLKAAGKTRTWTAVLRRTWTVVLKKTRTVVLRRTRTVVPRRTRIAAVLGRMWMMSRLEASALGTPRENYFYRGVL